MFYIVYGIPYHLYSNDWAKTFFIVNMAGNKDNKQTDNENVENADPIEEENEENIREEYDLLDSKLDELNLALDFLEQKNDDIHQKLKELLQSNIDIRQELRNENCQANQGQ
ncbi:uncharacterized protein [Epargyreus clarus]|uniref:uncharacterized protein isoform X1 n=2 Tax=Epargyreus clarus TaxID=520877 RepID=UPI003C309A74